MQLSKVTINITTGAETRQTYTESRYISLKPSDRTQPVPAPPTSRVDLSSSYYFIYNKNDWIAMINDAFELLTRILISDFASSIPSFSCLHHL